MHGEDDAPRSVYVAVDHSDNVAASFDLPPHETHA